MSDEQLVNFGSKVFFQSTFSIVTIYYLVKLNELNKILSIGVDTDNPFEVAMYNSGEPCLFALLALVLVFIALVLSVWYFRVALSEETTHFGILAVVTILLNIIFVILIWLLINDPILRAVIIVLSVGIVAFYGVLSR